MDAASGSGLGSIVVVKHKRILKIAIDRLAIQNTYIG
jgi:hypothetical protein